MGDFALDINKFIEKTQSKANKAVKKVCLDLTAGIIKKTPVDKGRARANWQASINVPIQTETQATDKSGAITIAKSSTVISQAVGNIFYLSNNLPYIAALEYGLYGTGKYATEKTTRDGYSIQAPYGMVRITLMDIKNSFNLIG